MALATRSGSPHLTLTLTLTLALALAPIPTPTPTPHASRLTPHASRLTPHPSPSPLPYQVVIAFTASAAALQEWIDAGSEAARLFARFVNDAPEGIVPSSGDIDIKERVKLVPRVDNMKQMGLGWIERYNGKPALITKSGSVYRGDDYIEVRMDTFRLAYML